VASISKEPNGRRMEIIYHEAGHTAILFMFGQVFNIERVNVTGKGPVAASVEWRALDTLTWLDLYGASTSALYQQIRVNKLKWATMLCLAGYAAEKHVNPHGDWIWFDDLLECPEWCWDGTEDFAKALNLAKMLYGDTGRARHFLRRMNDWTEEALHDPRLWAVVEAVAKRLLTTKRRVGGRKLFDITTEAFGESHGLPYMEMGRNWRRRFRLDIPSG